MSAEEHQIEERKASGYYNRGRLIRFGYLSEQERKRLIATYPDLEDRFEPEPEYDTFTHALFIYIALMFGMAVGYGHFGIEGFIGWSNLLPYIVTTIIYWGLALWILRDLDRRDEERTERYWEWHGYRCDKYGRKIG